MHASWQPAAPDGAGAFAPSLSRAQYKERARLCTRAALAELAGEARTASARTRTRALAVCAGSACIAAASLAALYKHLLWQQTSPSLEVGPAAVETPLEASTELVAFPSSRSAERAGAATALPAPAAAALAAFQSWLPCDSSRGPCALPEHGTVDIGPALPVALCLLAALKLADILAAVWKAMRKRRAVPISKPQQQSEPAAALDERLLALNEAVAHLDARRRTVECKLREKSEMMSLLQSELSSLQLDFNAVCAECDKLRNERGSGSARSESGGRDSVRGPTARGPLGTPLSVKVPEPGRRSSPGYSASGPSLAPFPRFEERKLSTSDLESTDEAGTPCVPHLTMTPSLRVKGSASDSSSQPGSRRSSE